MTEIPTWWLVVSAAFFVLNICFFAVLTFILVKFAQLARDLTPKINNISDRLESISVKVDELAETTKQTVTGVGGHAKSIAGSVDIITHSVSVAVERYAPALAAIMTGLKILKAVRLYRSATAPVTNINVTEDAVKTNPKALPKGK